MKAGTSGSGVRDPVPKDRENDLPASGSGGVTPWCAAFFQHRGQCCWSRVLSDYYYLHALRGAVPRVRFGEALSDDISITALLGGGTKKRPVISPRLFLGDRRGFRRGSFCSMVTHAGTRARPRCF